MYREDLIRRLEEVSLGVRKVRTRVFEKHGLRSGQARVLSALLEYGELSQADIGRLLDISAPTVKRQVEGLVNDGDISLTESGADRRLNMVALTKGGRKKEKLIKRCNAEIGSIVNKGLSEPEIIMTGLLLTRISENLRHDQENS